MEKLEHLIEQYLLGQLEGEALRSFEERLANDPSLVETVEESRAALQVVDAFGDIEMRERIARIHVEERDRGGRSRLLLRWGSIAATLLLLVGLALWVFPSASAPEQLFAENYESYELNFTARSTANEKLLSEANALYQVEDYAKALLPLQELYTQDDSWSKVGLAIGICLIETEQPAAAIQHFLQIKNKDFDLYQDQATWYLALLYLRQGQKNQSKDLLQELIKKPDASFHEAAKKLFREF